MHGRHSPAIGLASTTVITAHDRLLAAYFRGWVYSNAADPAVGRQPCQQDRRAFSRNAQCRTAYRHGPVCAGRARRRHGDDVARRRTNGAGRHRPHRWQSARADWRQLPGAVPAFFFIDIQDDQAAEFDATVAAVPGVSSSRRVPALRGRIVAIAGVPVETAPVAPGATGGGDRAGRLRRERAGRSSHRRWLVVAGRLHRRSIVSLDAGLAKGFGVGVGDRLTLNVLGRDIGS